MKKQGYSNHRRYHFAYHFVLLTILVVTFIGSMINFVESLTSENDTNLYSASLLVAVCLILAGLYIYARSFALRAQDRAIRGEENFRHFVLTGKPLDHRIHLKQIIALRFAPDDEFVDLCKETAERQLTPDEIKKSIRRWKGDYHRV